MIIPISGDEEPFAFMQTTFNEWEGMFSPDGRWFTFSSDESGREEVYVAPFPGPGGKWQVSTSEGDRGNWSADGRKIFYLDNEDRINVAEVETTANAVRVGRVETLFPVNASRPGNIFCLMDEGRKILVNELTASGETSTIVLVQNWDRDIGR
jgi:hypothetical protein